MCSINGITWDDTGLVARMNEVTRHRGPDGSALAQLHGSGPSGSSTFGHNRLSIIDPDPRSNQPMQTPNGRYAIIFNGEIYNFKSLRSDLRNHYKFKTESDTEVILAGFQTWGKGIFSKLNGMYALAIHDSEQGTVTLARDPMGIKPLYITKTKKGFAFSSEIKALLEMGVSLTLNRTAFDSYMRTLYVPAPYTLFEGIEKFPPGHMGTIRTSSLSLELEPFTFHLEASPPEATPLDWRDSAGLREAVYQAVSQQMVSDRPLGVYLSGGIDSSGVLAAATRAGGAMNTFSIGFELGAGEEFEKFNADSTLAKRIAAHFGAQHHEFFIRPDEVLGLFKKAIHHLDEPVANATIAAQVALSSYARESVVVALTGDGGDEVFGGYPRYLMSRRMDALQRVVPARALALAPGRFKHLAAKSIDERFALFHFQKNQVLKRILNSSDLRNHYRAGEARDMMEADRNTWLVDEALLRSDKLGMAHGLETRPPLLDLELMHRVQHIPFEKHVSLWDTKILLKRALENDLPAWVVNQPKRGWFSPGAKWLRHEALKKELNEILAPGYAAETDTLFNWDGVRTLWQTHRERRGYYAPALLSVLMFQLWAKRFSVSL